MELVPPGSPFTLRCEERECLPHRELSALYAISQTLAVRAGQRESLLEILKVLEQELGMMRGTVMLLAPDGSELVVAAAHNADGDVHPHVRYRPGEGITGEVVRTGRAISVPCVAQEPRFQNRVHARSGVSASDISFVCVPVLLGLDVVGTLAVDLPLQQAAKLSDQEQVLGIVASMIAHDVKARRTLQQERQALETENLRLRDALGENFRPENMVGNSRARSQGRSPGRAVTWNTAQCRPASRIPGTRNTRLAGPLAQPAPTLCYSCAASGDVRAATTAFAKGATAATKYSEGAGRQDDQRLRSQATSGSALPTANSHSGGLT
jgi:putative methionine-R-sulfoxide reductase with GAF domain